LPTKTLSHRDRLETCLSGSTPDQVPVSLWRHFPVDDQTPEGLALATSTFQRLYDFDFIKVTPASSFCLRDWGAQDRWKGTTEGTRDYENAVIQHPEDWLKLKVLSPLEGGLGNQLRCLQMLKKEFSSDVPLMQTVFSPLAQAKNLVGRDSLALFMRLYPDALHAGLERIAQTTLQFVEELLRLKIDGIFYAVQHAQYGLHTLEEFLTFGKSYDLRILAAADRFWLNMVHLHGENVMFDVVKEYPVQIINWHDRHTPPSLADAQAAFPGVVCGGLRRWETLVLGNTDHVKAEAFDAIQATAGKRFILGTGCVLPIIAPHGNILAARQSVSNNQMKS
jgi:uroporphyrinogen decarboxylase